MGVFTGLALGTNYAMIGIVNVKLMDSLVFIASFLFGLRIGLAVGVSIWSIYGFVNPWGQDDFVTLAFVMSGECLYAIAGAVLARSSVSRQISKEGDTSKSLIVASPVVFGAVGLITTFAYDIWTNFGTYALKTSSLYQAFLIGEISGAPFAIVHELSNVFFFAVLAPAAIIAAQRYSSITGRV